MIKPELLGTPHLPEAEPPDLPTAEAVALHSLAFGPVLREVIDSSRRNIIVQRDPRVQKYCISNVSGDEIGSGATDTYFSARISSYGSRGHDKRWRMSLSFLDMVLTEEDRYKNHRTLYRFLWDETSALGHKTLQAAEPTGFVDNVQFMAALPDRKTGTPKEQLVKAATIDTRQQITASWIEQQDCDEAAQRLLSVIDAVRSSVVYQMFSNSSGELS